MTTEKRKDAGMSFWTPERQQHLRAWAGKKPDDRIATDLGCATITVRKERTAMGLEAYRGRPNWDRRQALLNSAAGLDFCVSPRVPISMWPAHSTTGAES